MTFETTKNKLFKLWNQSLSTEDNVKKIVSKNTANTKLFPSLASVQSLVKRLRDISPGWVQMNTATSTFQVNEDNEPIPTDNFSGLPHASDVIGCVEKTGIVALYYTWKIEIGNIHKDNLLFISTEFLFKSEPPDNAGEVEFNLLNDTVWKDVYFEVKHLPDTTNLRIKIGQTREEALAEAEPDSKNPIKHVSLCANAWIIRSVNFNDEDKRLFLPETEVKLLIKVINKNYIQ